MHGRIKKVTNEIVVVVTSADFGYCKPFAIADATEYVAEAYPGERWEYVDVDLDKYNAWSVRFSAQTPGPNASRTNDPDWGAT